MDIPTYAAESDMAEPKVRHLWVRGSYLMNAQAILSYFWRSEPVAQPMKKDFPAEAYSYDDPISKEVVAEIQKEANKKLGKQQWTVIERLGDGGKL